jgi:peptidyl-prolyl cis-trans isomerase B (cyclophilin B)
MPTEKQRRDAERRRQQRQLRRRAARDARRRRFALIASIVGVLAVAAVVITVVVATNNDNSGTPAAGGPSPGHSSTGQPAGTCTWTTTSNPAKPGIAKPSVNPPTSGTVDLLAQTTQGSMTFQLDQSAAPCAVASFTSLAEQGYFNNTPCHRLTSGNLSVLQCGDPTGTGSGGPGYSFADELTGHEKYTRGVLAMANSGPNTNGSQFFIVYKNSALPPKYTIFGKVTSDMKVVDKVAAQGSTPTGDGKPNLPISLNTVGVVQ